MLSRSTLNARSMRRGLSLLEVLIAIVIMGIVMAFVGHISSSVAEANRKNEVIAKRTFAMQQQANIIGAMPFASLTPTMLPASKTFKLGDFTYDRRVTMTSTGTTTAGLTKAITITIVPQTGIPGDTLLQESLSMIRTSPNCGTALQIVAC